MHLLPLGPDPLALAPGSSGESASVWFSFTPPKSGRVTLTTLGSTGSSAIISSYFTMLAMYRTGNPAGAPVFTNIVLVAQDISGCRGAAIYACIHVPQSVVAGTRYYFQVDGRFGTKGNVVLAMTYTA